MKSKTKTEADSPLRIPKAKNKLGLRIHKISMPHDDLIRAEKPLPEIAPIIKEETTLPSQSAGQNSQIAPTRNYQKVPNSITKLAIPEGLFKGKDKHLYDVLYSLTRGAIEPTRKVRISKTKLMKLSGIGARNTFDSCIERLQSINLLNLQIFAGEHQGNEFEVFLLGEAETQNSLPSLSSLTRGNKSDYSDSKLVRLLRLETSQTRHTLNDVDKDTYANPKTSLKTNTNDDERETAFSEFFRKISAACERITGKPISKHEREKWGNFADLLILEFESAARRTDSISSAPAFFTEVLRRKLMNTHTSNTFTANKVKPDTVGKNHQTDEYEIKPLGEDSLDEALNYLKEFVNDNFLEDFRKWYTPEDWSWLINQLEKESEKK